MIKLYGTALLIHSILIGCICTSVYGMEQDFNFEKAKKKHRLHHVNKSKGQNPFSAQSLENKQEQQSATPNTTSSMPKSDTGKAVFNYLAELKLTEIKEKKLIKKTSSLTQDLRKILTDPQLKQDYASKNLAIDFNRDTLKLLSSIERKAIEKHILDAIKDLPDEEQFKEELRQIIVLHTPKVAKRSKAPLPQEFIEASQQEEFFKSKQKIYLKNLENLINESSESSISLSEEEEIAKDDSAADDSLLDSFVYLESQADMPLSSHSNTDAPPQEHDSQNPLPPAKTLLNKDSKEQERDASTDTKSRTTSNRKSKILNTRKKSMHKREETQSFIPKRYLAFGIVGLVAALVLYKKFYKAPQQQEVTAR